MRQRVSEQTSMGSPKVSVAMATYNHEPYIAEAIESVLMQETDFVVELVIGEDCSTDATRRIVKEYADRYPGVIRAILHEDNQGMMANGILVLKACRGDYIAFLEGDDFWTAPSKLHEQVQVLDQDSRVSLVFHQATTLTGTTSRLYRPATDGDRMFTFEDFAAMSLGQVPTASMVVRRSVLQNLPDWFIRLPFGDLSILGLAAEAGMLCFLDRCWSIYRIHPGGAAGQMQFADAGGYLEKNLRFEDGQRRLYDEMLRRNPRCAKALRSSIANFSLNAAWAARLLSRPIQSLRHALRALCADPNATLRSGPFWRTLASCMFPFLDTRRLQHLLELERDLQVRRSNFGFSTTEGERSCR